jgi:uncharacterized transporter YbjL
MHIDMNITLANILTFLGMLIGGVVAFMRFQSKINEKADKAEVERIKGNQEILLIEIRSINTKLDELKLENNKKFDELRKKFEEYVEKQDRLNTEFYIIQSDHKKNH